MSSFRVPTVGASDAVWAHWLGKWKYSLTVNAHRVGSQKSFSAWLQRLARELSTWKRRHEISELRFVGFSENQPVEVDGKVVVGVIEVLREHLNELALTIDVSLLCDIAERVASMPKLRLLTLSKIDCSIDRGAAVAAFLSKCPNLCQLQFDECIVGRMNADLIAKTFPFATLENFGMMYCSFNDPRGIAQILRDCQRIRSVAFMDELKEPFRAGLIDVLLALSDKPSFEELNLHVVLSEQSFPADVLQKLSSLQSTFLHFRESGEFFEQVCLSLRHLTHLRTLFLRFDDTLTEDGDRVLSELLMCSSNISTLNICAAYSIALQHVSRYLSSAGCKLRRLELSASVCHDMEAIAKSLKWNSSLTFLEVSVVEVENEQAVAVAFADAFIHNSTLRKFSYAGEFSDDGFDRLMSGLRFSVVEKLDLLSSQSASASASRKLEEIAKMGYLVETTLVESLDACGQRMEFNKKLHSAAKRAVIAMLWARRFRKSILNVFPNDIVKLFAGALFLTRCYDDWAKCV